MPSLLVGAGRLLVCAIAVAACRHDDRATTTPAPAPPPIGTRAVVPEPPPMPPMPPVTTDAGPAPVADGIGTDAAEGDQLARLAASRARLQGLLDAAGGRYRYVRTTTSWAGYDADTTFAVAAGAVVERRYRVTRPGPHGHGEVVDHAWTEAGPKVGSHDEGHPVQTLPALYDECASHIAAARRHPEMLVLFFDLDDAGLLRTCGVVAKGCADDCFDGIGLDSIDVGAAPR